MIATMALLRTPCQVASQPASAVAGARCFRCTAGPARDNRNWARDGWLQASEFHTLLLAQTLSQYFLSVLFFVIVTSSQGLSLQVVDPFFSLSGLLGEIRSGGECLALCLGLGGFKQTELGVKHQQLNMR